ncbi:unnamed protein product [Larinioides sclopetarius]|uniref:Carboxylesterase type B domain-containing protein n=1 Tax=Larinioides sclopetarius TaxID=280406 RepID=A0AAV1YW74_9ARAC
MESGSPAYPDKGSTKLNMDISQKIAERLFCANKTNTIQNNPAGVLECLRKMGSEALTDVNAAMQPLSSVLYIPQYGNELVPMDPQKALQNNNFTCNDLLIGNTNDEGSYQLTTLNPAVYGFFGDLNPAINKTLGEKEMKRMLYAFPDRDKVVQHYLPDSLPNDAYETIREKVYTSFGDISIVCPVTFYAEQCAKTGGNVYKYVWNHRPTKSVWFPWMGVAHGNEVEFVFGTPFLHSFYYRQDEINLSKTVIDIWSSFAKNGGFHPMERIPHEGQSTYVFQILLISCITLYFFERAKCEPVVDVGKTQIVGRSVYSGKSIVNQFLAVPYAEPPIGQLRFKKPVARKVLPSLYYALNNPPVCWQKSMYPFPWYDPSPLKDENCLYLNIWSPENASPTNKKAVIYFIHGGGFRFGSIMQKAYFGAPLAAHGDLIVVTVNYRLGAFGFLTADTEDAPGNVGLYDILEGLKWVNKYIEAFGGDTSRITLAGQGAGSSAAALLSTSPLAKGLFQRVIMESGSPSYPGNGTIELNLDIGQMVAERLFCASETQTIQNSPAKVLKCLRNVTAESLADVTEAMHPLSSVLFIPQFGGELLPNDPQKALQNGNFTCNDLLIGNTNDEGSYQLTTHHPDVYGFFGALNPTINKTLGKEEIKRKFQAFPDYEKVVQHYLPDSLPNDAYETIRKNVYTSFGDASIVCPVMFYAEQCAKTGGNVYKYVWNHRPTKSVWFPWMGVVHGTEVEFVFGTPLLHPFHYTSDEVDLSKKIIDIWSSFAKNGKPDISWPEFSKENPHVKVLGPGLNDFENQTGFHRENCNFFRHYFGF